MIVGIPRETFAGEHRVALVPDAVSVLAALNVEIVVEPGAGESAGFADANYAKQGADIAADRDRSSPEPMLYCRCAPLAPTHKPVVPTSHEPVRGKCLSAHRIP